MSLEFAASRLYAPYFGNSIYVWGSLISLVMVALSGGYALGGWLADRSSSDTGLFALILASGLYQLVVVFAAYAILIRLWQMPEFSGTGIATLILFVPPTLALATASPFVIRLLAREGHVGTIAGKVCALSTAGSVAGILATSLLLVPRLGTRTTLELLCALSILLGAAGLAVSKRVGTLGLLPLVVVLFVPKTKLSQPYVWRAESVYNSVSVVKTHGLKMLILNSPRYVQTIQKESGDWGGYYYENFALGPLIVPAQRLLVMGLGAGGSIISTRVTAPQIQIDAVEIDPKVVEAAVRYFGLPASDKNLRVHVADARPWLAHDTQRYDFVHVDLYQGGPYIPFYLTTVEFFRSVRQHMTDGGLLMMNVLDAAQQHELLYAIGATLKQVFPTVMALPGQGNTIVFAFSAPRTLASVRQALSNYTGPEEVQTLARSAANSMVDLQIPAGTQFLTDDRAPIEAMTWRALHSGAK
jgi:spermidine synthase